MNEEVLEIHHDKLYTSGERLYNQTNGAQLWSRPLENGDLAVIAYNSDNLNEFTITIDWTELGWNSDSLVNVHCLWGKVDVGQFSNSFTTPTIPVHDHYFYRLSRVENK